MPDANLLTVVSDTLHVDFRGPTSNDRFNVVGPRAVRPTLEIRGPKGIKVTLGDAASRDDWNPGDAGPFFFEATRYRVVAISSRGGAPVVAHRDPGLIVETDRFREQRTTVAAFDFHQQVGLSRFTISSDWESFDITVEVYPTKLDYRTDYEELLRDIAGTARGLALEFLRSTFRRGKANNVATSNDLEWVSLLRATVDDLNRALQFIAVYPKKQLSVELGPRRIEAVRGTARSVLKSLRRHPKSGPWTTLKGMRVKARIDAPIKVDSVNTPEHRWLKQQLFLIGDRLTFIRAHENGRRRGELSPRGEAEHKELALIASKVAEMTALPFLQAAQGSTQPEFTSLPLMQSPGYSLAYQCLHALRSSLQLGGPDVELSLKSLDQLYEIWCFVEISKIVLEISDTTTDISELISVESSGLRVRLKRGQRSTIRTSRPGCEISLSYNREFPGLTGEQKPDIVLELRFDGWPEIVVVFDAKYRLDATPDYVKTFAGIGPPIDAVNALHRYRDAIVLGRDNAPRGRPVVKGVALFPSPDELAFTDHRLRTSLDVVGVGALPFLPGRTNTVKNWLRALMLSRPEDLAAAGPPFMAQSHLDTRETGGGVF